MAIARSKSGYLNKAEIKDRLSKGLLDIYDVIYTKDTNELFVISQDLKPIEIKSRVNIYKTKVEAETDLNSRTDTYEGQMVCIYRAEDSSYIAHIVGINEEGKFYVAPISAENSELIIPSMLVEGSNELEWNKVFMFNLEPGVTELSDGASTITQFIDDRGIVNLKIYPNATLLDDGSGNVALLI